MGFTVTFVRHGETQFNKNELVHGSSNGSINDTGINQATELGKSLQNEVFTRIFCSDLERCKDTAKHALSQLKTKVPEIVYDPRLREKDFGEWEGQPNKVMVKAMIEQKCDPIKLQTPGGESYEDLIARVKSFLEDLFKLVDTVDQDENILVVSHGMTIQTFLRYLASQRESLDLGDYKFNLLNNARNTSKTRMTVHRPDEQGKRKIEIHCVHDCSHLPAKGARSILPDDEETKKKLLDFMSKHGLLAKQ